MTQATVHNSSWKTYLLFVCCIALILLPLLYFPLSLDHSMYTRAGDCLLAGGKIYKDYIDVKPPLFYYYFAAVRFLFGNGEYGFRTADFLMQLVCISWLAWLTRKLSGSMVWGFATGIIYALCYVAPGFTVVMQPDTVALPLFLVVIAAQFREKLSWRYALLIGITSGLLIGLKFTFGIVVAAVVVCDILDARYSMGAYLRKYLWIGSGFVLGLLLAFAPLLDAETRSAFGDVTAYLRVYAAHPPLDFNFIKIALKAQAYYIGDMLSLSVVAFVVIAFLALLRTQPTASNTPHNNARLVISMAVFAFLLWVTVIIERKFIINHFMRSFAPLAIVAGCGAEYLWQQRQRFNNIGKRYGIALALLIGGGMLTFSPLPRYLNSLRIVHYYYADMGLYNAMFEDDRLISFDRVQVLQTAEYLNAHKQPGEKTLVMGIGIIQLYQYIHEPVWSHFGDSHFYFADGVPQVWKERMHTEVRMADWIVMGTNDPNSVFNQHERTTWQSLQLDTAIYPYFQEHFTPVLTLRSLTLYKRKEKSRSE